MNVGVRRVAVGEAKGVPHPINREKMATEAITSCPILSSFLTASFGLNAACPMMGQGNYL